MTAVMALARLALDPVDVNGHIKSVSALMPEAAAQIILDQAVAVAGL